MIFSELLVWFVDICLSVFGAFFVCGFGFFFIMIRSRNRNYWCWTINMDTKNHTYKHTMVGERVRDFNRSHEIYSKWQLDGLDEFLKRMAPSTDKKKRQRRWQNIEWNKIYVVAVKDERVAERTPNKTLYLLLFTVLIFASVDHFLYPIIALCYLSLILRKIFYLFMWHAPSKAHIKCNKISQMKKKNHSLTHTHSAKMLLFNGKINTRDFGFSEWKSPESFLKVHVDIFEFDFCFISFRFLCQPSAYVCVYAESNSFEISHSFSSSSSSLLLILRLTYLLYFGCIFRETEWTFTYCGCHPFFGHILNVATISTSVDSHILSNRLFFFSITSFFGMSFTRLFIQFSMFSVVNRENPNCNLNICYHRQ